MITPKSWDDFRKTGLVVFINSILHAFGWAIVFEVDESGNVKNCYPARVKFRGFGEHDTEESHKQIATYLKENAEELNKEVNDE